MPTHATLRVEPVRRPARSPAGSCVGVGDELTAACTSTVHPQGKTISRIDGILLRRAASPRRSGPVAGTARSHRHFKTSGKYVYARLEYGGDRGACILHRWPTRSTCCRRRSLDLPASQLRSVPAPGLRLDRHLPGLPARRRLQDRVNTYRKRLHVGAQGNDAWLNQAANTRINSWRRSPKRAARAEAEVRAPNIDQGPFQPVDALRVGT